MGQLVEGRWVESVDRPTDKSGAFVRASSAFRHWITADGSAGPSGDDGFQAEAGRYHLFVAPSCPWAHRAVLFRQLKGLEDIVSMSQADAPKSAGWSFTQGLDEMQPNDDGVLRLHQVYTTVAPDYTGNVTVPLLWDRKRKTIVNNESAEIIRMLNSSFDGIGARGIDYCPDDLMGQIDDINAFVYEHINNGVYRAGFAKTQEAYDAAVTKVFAGLDHLEDILSRQQYLAGDRVTEADWRAFPTLLRFDLVYYSHFKCNVRRLQDYPRLVELTRELYQWPGISDVCDLPATKAGYYLTMPGVNPTGVVPAGPDMSWLDVPHSRAAPAH